MEMPRKFGKGFAVEHIVRQMFFKYSVVLSREGAFFSGKWLNQLTLSSSNGIIL